MRERSQTPTFVVQFKTEDVYNCFFRCFTGLCLQGSSYPQDVLRIRGSVHKNTPRVLHDKIASRIKTNLCVLWKGMLGLTLVYSYIVTTILKLTLLVSFGGRDGWERERERQTETERRRERERAREGEIDREREREIQDAMQDKTPATQETKGDTFEPELDLSLRFVLKMPFVLKISLPG